MASKFTMMHEKVEQQHQAAMDAEDKMASAMNDLRVKAAAQERGRRDTQRYQEQSAWEQQERPEMPEAKARFAGDDAGYMFADHQQEHTDIHELHHGKNQELGKGNNSDSDSDDEFDDLLDDPEIMKIRNKRLTQMRAEQTHKQELLSKGHGTYNEVLEENFLKEVCNAAALKKADKTKYTNDEDVEEDEVAGCVVCHFFHKDFEKCKVIDKHLQRIAMEHLEAKFIRINAEKTPFFVEKLQVRILPCVVMFIDGVAQEGRIMGFEGLADDMPDDRKDEFPTSKVKELLGAMGAISYTAPTEEMEEEMKNRGGSIFGGSKFDNEFDEEEDYN